MKRIIIDSDLGCDIDDAIAISFACKSEEITLEGVTTVYGDVDFRARHAKNLVALAGKPDVKVYKGIEKPLLQARPVWMADLEKDLIVDDATAEIESMHAVDFIIETIMNNPGEITLVAIGPLTNVATAIIKEPKIVDNVAEIIIMGGLINHGISHIGDGEIEHNICSDPEAASIVYGCGANITSVGLDVTLQVIVGKKERQRLVDAGNALCNKIVNMYDNWLVFIKDDKSYMHDPLTVALVFNKSLVKTITADIEVEYTKEHPSGKTIAHRNDESKTEVCMEVNSKEFMDHLLDTITK